MKYMTPKCNPFFKKVLHFGKMYQFGKIYYFWTYLGVPNFGTISFFSLFYSITNYCSMFQYILFILHYFLTIFHIYK